MTAARQGPKARVEPRRTPWKPLAVALLVVAAFAASFVLPGWLDESRPADHAAVQHEGDGLPAGTKAPAFSETDVVTGSPIESAALAGKRTLLFFSEGVMCQACFVQIRELEKVGATLRGRGIELISITPDPADVLREAVEAYGITTPMIADDDRNMSAAYDTLGQGMHADTPGHAFVLVDETGTIAWQKDYWITAERTMYVEPEQLLAELPA